MHPVDWSSPRHSLAAKEPRRGERAVLRVTLDAPSGPLVAYCAHFEVFCGGLARLCSLSDVFRDIRSVASAGYSRIALLGDLNTMGHGVARLSPHYCRDRLRWRTLGRDEAVVWERVLRCLDGETRRGDGLAASGRRAEPEGAGGAGLPPPVAPLPASDLGVASRGSRAGPKLVRLSSRVLKSAAPWQLTPSLRRRRGPASTRAAASRQGGWVRLGARESALGTGARDGPTWAPGDGDGAAGADGETSRVRPPDLPPSGGGNPYALRLGVPEEYAAHLSNPGLHDPFPASTTVTLDNPAYRLCGIPLMRGKLDWMLLRGFRVVEKRVGNLEYEHSDHRWLAVEVVDATSYDEAGR